MIKQSLTFIVIVIILSSFTNALEVTEIFANPYGNEALMEFVEIKWQGMINFSLLQINESGNLDVVNAYKVVNESNIALILSENANLSYFEKFNCTLLLTNGIIGNGLNNNAGHIELIYNGSKVYEINYSGVAEGHSIEIFNGTAFESLDVNGTPCSYNFSLHVNESVNNSNSSINNSVNNETNESIVCPTYFIVSTNKEFYEEGERVKLEFDFDDNIKDYEIEYWIDTYFGENVKAKITSKSKRRKSFTPRNLEKGFNIFVFKAKLFVENCSEMYDESLFFVYSNKSNEAKECKEVIVNVSKTREEWNSSLELEEKEDDVIIFIRRGNTRKYVVSLEVESNNSKEEISKFRIREDVKNLSITVSKKVICSLVEGNVSVSVSGLGFEKNITIECPKKEVAKKVEVKEKVIPLLAASQEGSREDSKITTYAIKEPLYKESFNGSVERKEENKNKDYGDEINRKFIVFSLLNILAALIISYTMKRN